MTQITAPVVEVELFTWMKRITAKNNGKHYLMIGQLKDRPNTLLVTLEHGNGGAVMFCQIHSAVYHIMGKCSDCQNAPREEHTAVSVTAS